MSIVQLGWLLALGAPFALAACVARSHRRVLARHIAAGCPGPEADGPDTTGSRFESDTIELETAVRAAADALTHLARADWVRIDFAVARGMMVYVNPSALRTALQETMLTAIRATPGGHVLITAQVLGSQLHIRVTDDGPDTDQPYREALARGAEAVIALQGGSVNVDARSGQCTTVTLRLPLPAETAVETASAPRVAILASQAA